MQAVSGTLKLIFPLLFTQPHGVQVIEQLVSVYNDAPLAVRGTTFASVVSGLGQCMEVRGGCVSEQLDCCN